jgi:arginase family enzyme
MIEMREFRQDRDLKLEGPVYITFDLDGLDPSFAPGVAHREGGGLTTRQALDVIHRVGGPIVGADVVEFNPKLDSSGLTAFTAAKLVKEIAGRMLVQGPGS